MMKLLADLIAAEIISAEDEGKLTSAVKTHENALTVLYYFFESKVITRPKNGGFMFSMNPLKGYDASKITGDTSSYEALLNILFKHHVITQPVYEKLNPFKVPGNKNTYLGALYMAVELDSFYRQFTTENQLKFMVMLKGRNRYGHDDMLGYIKQEQLQKDINAGKLETYFDFFEYMPGCNTISLRTYQLQPKKLFNKLKTLFNKRSQDTFKIVDIQINKERRVLEYGKPIKRKTITINTGARVHSHTYKDDVYPEYATAFLIENVLILINKLLADYSCEYRFASFTSHLNHELFPAHRFKLAICTLTRDQEQLFDFESLKDKYLYAKPSHLGLSYRLPLSYTHIEYATYQFKHCGLLSHLSDEMLNENKSTLFSTTYQDTNDLLAAFPETVYVLDNYIYPGQKPHLDFLEGLNKISHGILNFTDIVDGLPESFSYDTEMDFIVAFTLNGQRHEVRCEVSGNHFAHHLHRYVADKIMLTHYTKYQLLFITATTYGHDYVAIATKEQTAYLSDLNLISIHPYFN